MKEQNGVIFNKKIFATGGSQAIILPPELLAYIEASEGNEIELTGYNGKHGKYLSIWKKK